MYKVKDNAESQLQFGISSVATTLVVKEGQGAKFPEVPFLVVLNKRNSDWEITKSEKVEVSSVNGDQFTISRGYEWTTPSDFSADDFVSLFVLARHIEELQTEVAKKADQTDVQSVASRTDSLEEKMTTALNWLEKLENVDQMLSDIDLLKEKTTALEWEVLWDGVPVTLITGYKSGNGTDAAQFNCPKKSFCYFRIRLSTSSYWGDSSGHVKLSHKGKVIWGLSRNWDWTAEGYLILPKGEIKMEIYKWNTRGYSPDMHYTLTTQE